jgi:TolB-like protein/Tfp pilus assembly protein PilF
MIAGSWWAWVAWVHPTLESRDIRSLAVLPFENISANKEETEYRANGLTEDLIIALTQIEVLRVIAPNSSLFFKDKAQDPREVGNRLDVDAVVKGSLQVEGTTMRVTAQLIKVKDGHLLWSKAYKHELRERFVLQEAIVRQIVQALAVELDATDAAEIAARPTEDLDAYDLYLQGRFSFSKRTRAGLEGAILFFDSALARDAKYALAYSGLADTYVQLQLQNFWPRQNACAKARLAAGEALRLDPSRAEIRTSVGRVLWPCNDDLAGAEREFKQAIRLNPNYALAHGWYGHLLSSLMGRHEEGIAEGRIARALDPVSRVVLGAAGNAFFAAGQYDSAITMYRSVREIEPSVEGVGLGLARAYLQKKEWVKSAALLDTMLQAGVEQRRALSHLGYIHAQQNRPESARMILRQLEEWAGGKMCGTRWRGSTWVWRVRARAACPRESGSRGTPGWSADHSEYRSNDGSAAQRSALRCALRAHSREAAVRLARRRRRNNAERSSGQAMTRLRNDDLSD